MAGAAFATGGQSGNGESAYALVNPNGGSPVLIANDTSGFSDVNVGPFGPGDYCLTPAPGVSINGIAAVASMEAFYSDAIGLVAVRYPTRGPTCRSGQLEVKTWDARTLSTGTPSLSDQIAFTVYVPAQAGSQ
jgi:hypothetical protein